MFTPTRNRVLVATSALAGVLGAFLETTPRIWA